MSTHQQRLTSATETCLTMLIHDAANLDLQLYELNKLRYRVRQAQRLARKSRGTNHQRRTRI